MPSSPWLRSPAVALLSACLAACASHHDANGSAGGAGGKADDPHDHSSHAGMPPAPVLLPLAPWDAGSALDTVAAADEDADDAVVEVSLVAEATEHALLDGKPTAVWTYNGTLPGPRIEANVGDRVVVHLENRLPATTSIHWHGVRVPNAMDGMIPVPPGATFTYDFVVTDPGLYWYHPHFFTSEQVDRGLYGALLVRDPSEPALAVASDRVLLVDDALVDATSGALDTSSRDARIDMMGREGNLVLVNGHPANAGFSVHAGEWHRIRLVNAANARYFRLALEGGTMVRLGDEVGGIEAPAIATDLFLVPGDRLDLLVSVDAPGTEAVLKAVPYERAVGAGASEAVNLVRWVADATAVARPALPATWRVFEPPGLPVVTRPVALSEVMANGTMRFLINGAEYPNGPVALVKEGTVERWRIMNHSGMDHPFHLHGFFFSPVGTREWHDTLNIRPHRAIDVDVWFAPRPLARGRWMYHCHILEHGDAGMMAELELGDTTGWRAAPTVDGGVDADAGVGHGHHH